MMKIRRIPALRALALVLCLGGCAGGGFEAPLTAAQGAPAPIQAGRPQSGSGCAPVSVSQNFDGTAISRGSWLWFSSVVSVPGFKGTLELVMTQSRITFTQSRRHYAIDGPDMHFFLNGDRRVRLVFEGRRDHWQLVAPYGTSGNDFVNGIAYRMGNRLPGDVRDVTWSAKFSELNRHPIDWRWGAAVYSTFTGAYNKLAVKPLDDSHYPPYNSDRAGTPEAYKKFLAPGATGNGGTDYTGTLSPPLTVTPCR
jgi:hypothetical protein